MVPFVRRSLPVLVAGALALGSAACSSTPSPAGSAGAPSSSPAAETPSAKDLYSKARTAALAAKSAHVKGTVQSSGSKISLDVAGRADGSNQKVVMTLGDKGTATIIAADTTVYIQADAKFWTANGGASIAKAVGSKFIAMGKDQASSLNEFSVGKLLSMMFEDKELGLLESLTAKVAKTEVDGVAAYQLTNGGADKGAVYVSADGKSTLLKIVGPTSSPGALTFTEWNAVAPVAAPPASQVIRP